MIENINLWFIVELFLMWAKNNKVKFFMFSASLFEVGQLKRLCNSVFTIDSNVLRFLRG